MELNKFTSVALLKINYICNQDCIFCHEDLINKIKINKHLNFKKLNFLLSLKKINTIMISGGEPLLYAKLFSLIKYFKRYKYNIIILTNGVVLDKNTVIKIRNYVDLVYFSLHSMNSRKDSLLTGKSYLESKLSNLDFLLDNNVPVIMRRLLLKNNVEEISKEIDFIFERYGKYKNFWLEFGVLELKGRKLASNLDKLYLDKSQIKFLSSSILNSSQANPGTFI